MKRLQEIPFHNQSPFLTSFFGKNLGLGGRPLSPHSTKGYASKMLNIDRQIMWTQKIFAEIELSSIQEVKGSIFYDHRLSDSHKQLCELPFL